MFSGIISALGNVKNITYNDIYSVDIEITKINLEDFEKSDNLIKIGCSIACSGVCLTLTEKKGNVLTFDISKETMSKTNISDWKIGSLVNLERALRVGDEIGGHFVTGHDDTVLELQNIIEEDGSKILFIKLNKEISPYIASKGSITIEGVSLTVNDVKNLAAVSDGVVIGSSIVQMINDASDSKEFARIETYLNEIRDALV